MRSPDAIDYARQVMARMRKIDPTRRISNLREVSGPSLGSVRHPKRWSESSGGQKVEINPGRGFSPRGVFEIVRLLPRSDGEFQYRIKSVDEPHERVVKEGRLRRL
jgi:hypothetical protein